MGAEKKRIGKYIDRTTVILIAVVFVIGAVIGAFGGYKISNLFNPKAKISATVVSEQLEKIQDLTTVKISQDGFVDYSEGNIAFINKKQFTMFYTSEIRAGVDLGNAQVDVSGDGQTVTITLPAPTIQSVSIDPDSMLFFDKKTALFNAADAEDTAEAMKQAKAESEKKLDKDAVLKQANEQAKSVVEKLCAPMAGDGTYQVNVKTTDA